MPASKREVINRLRELRQPTTLFGESDIDRYNRLVECEEKFGDDIRKGEEDETSISFLPKDTDIE